MTTKIVTPLDQCNIHSPIGNKARSLLLLRNHKFRIPQTLICPFDAYTAFQDYPDKTLKTLHSALTRFLSPDKTYAVRSSSNLEDDDHHSYAGLFTTLLHVSGIDRVAQAVQTVWSSAKAETVRTYINNQKLPKKNMAIAVLIQEMIPAEVSGVIFTQNPLNGNNETIIEAIKGSGEKLVQNGRTPFRWRIEKDHFIEQPENSPLNTQNIKALLDRTKKLTRLFGQQLDLEWCFSAGELYWLQMRKITIVQHTDIYTNIFSKEFLPGMIKPLVWSINIQLINKAWVKLLTQLVGKNDLDFRHMAKAFYYRAYFNTGVIENLFAKIGLSRKTLDAILFGGGRSGASLSYRPSVKTIRFLPRMIFFILKQLDLFKRLDRFLNETDTPISAITRHNGHLSSDREILETIQSLLARAHQISYYYLLLPLKFFFLSYLLKKGLKLDNTDLLFMDGSDQADIEQYNPTIYLSRLNTQFNALDNELQNSISSLTFDDFNQMAGIDDFKQAVHSFLKRFGHCSDSGNDFSFTPWRETPSLLLRIITSHAPPANGTPAGKKDILSGLPFYKKPLYRFLLKKTKKTRKYKEAVSYLFTCTYGLLRDSFRTLGARLRSKGYLENEDEIFYLYFDELKQIINGEVSVTEIRPTVVKRIDDFNRYSDLKLPPVIYGSQDPPVHHTSKFDLSGIVTSGGYYSGRIKVIRGIKEYGKLKQGDVLVIPYSDIGLAPLFAKAGAIISEAGGILSHCSIIAREYNIPAITSVPGACSLTDDTLVDVDGYTGEIIVRELP